MYVNREEYLILAAYVDALSHLPTESSRRSHGSFATGQFPPSVMAFVMAVPGRGIRIASTVHRKTRSLAALRRLAGHLTGFSGQGRIGHGTLMESLHRGAVELSRSDEPGHFGV